MDKKVISATTPATRGDCKRVWWTSFWNRGWATPRLSKIPSFAVDPQHHVPSKELVHFQAAYSNRQWHGGLARCLQQTCQPLERVGVLCFNWVTSSGSRKHDSWRCRCDLLLTVSWPAFKEKNTANYRRNCTRSGTFSKPERRQWGSCWSCVKTVCTNSRLVNTLHHCAQ